MRDANVSEFVQWFAVLCMIVCIALALTIPILMTSYDIEIVKKDYNCSCEGDKK